MIIYDHEEFEELMAKRVTIMISDKNDKKIRMMQAKLISTTASNWSFSEVANIVMDDGLLNESSLIKKASKSLQVA